MYTIEELVAKAKEWEKEICKGCICYRPSYAALIFPPLGQKVLFMSESPYNYPGQDVETLEDFITMDLQRKLARATHPRRWPRDIFEFIYHQTAVLRNSQRSLDRDLPKKRLLDPRCQENTKVPRGTR